MNLMAVRSRPRAAALLLVLLALATVLLVPARAHAAAPLRVMLSGDSITHGFSGSTTYRYYLYKEFVREGRPVDFVGYVNDYQPDVVVVRLGRSDLTAGRDSAAIASQMRVYVAHVRAAGPDTDLVIGTVLDAVSYPAKLLLADRARLQHESAASTGRRAQHARLTDRRWMAGDHGPSVRVVVR